MALREPQPVHLTVKVEGVVLPGWIAIALVATSILASLALLLTWSVNRELAREIRVLELHVQDVESVLIRSGAAERDDFADWGVAPQRTRPPSREQNKKE